MEEKRWRKTLRKRRERDSRSIKLIEKQPKSLVQSLIETSLTPSSDFSSSWMLENKSTRLHSSNKLRVIYKVEYLNKNPNESLKLAHSLKWLLKTRTKPNCKQFPYADIYYDCFNQIIMSFNIKARTPTALLEDN